ncbi:MAG: permease-like cell division protein FtsX [bacterium]|nr:permease-like cell division protein FtsX [bacterium]
MTAIIRIIKFALLDIMRNFGLSSMTVLILVLMLLSVNTLWSVDLVTKEAVRLVKDQINVSLYLASDINDKQLAEIKDYLSAFPEVVNLDVRSRDQVLKTFQDRHQMSKEVLDALQELGSNPFGPTLVLKTREVGDYQKILSALNVPEYQHLIEAKSFDQHEDAIGRLQNITGRIEGMGLGLSLIFLIISFVIIFNTVRVSIFSQHAEIGIKRLVGASNWFIRGPYIVVACIFTIISVGISIGIVFFALHWLDPYMAVAFPNGFSLTKYYNSHILLIFGSQAVAILFLNFASSWLAMRKQLKV